MTKISLAHAITLAVCGLTASSAASASVTMYNSNTITSSNTSATDGWTRLHDSNNDFVWTGPESQGNKGIVMPWVGTSANTYGPLPFSYSGSSHLNWAVNLTSTGDAGEISRADALTRYNFAAEVDTGGGAWNDNGLNASGQATVSGPTGWRHQTDIGLIKSDVTQKITLNLATLGQLQSPTFSRFGVTVFTGMDTNTGNYSHHGAWNCPGCSTPRPFTASNPFGTTGLNYLTHSDNVDAVNGISFIAQAGQVYSIYLGGFGFSRWNAGVDNYKLNITSSPVPVPGAAWLLGSALIGLISVNRRKPN